MTHLIAYIDIFMAFKLNIVWRTTMGRMWNNSFVNNGSKKD